MADGFIGTYTQYNSKGIYRFSINENTGILTDASLFCSIKNSRYLSYQDDTLFALFDTQNGSGIAAYDIYGKCISQLLFEKSGSCFLCIKNDIIYTANYHEGTVSKIEFKENTFTLIHSLSIKEKAGCHQVIIQDDVLLVPCLLLDVMYVLNESLEIINTIKFPVNSGPRHGILTDNDEYLIVLSELSNELFTLKRNGTNFEHLKKENAHNVTADLKQAGAAIRISKNKKNVYASIRGSNIISVFDISNINTLHYPINTFSCYGDHPRDILNVLYDKYLLVANRDTNELISFKIIENRIEKISSIIVPECICICMKE